MLRQWLFRPFFFQDNWALGALILTLGLVSNAEASFGTIWFSNLGLIDPDTGETYRAPIYASPGKGWGAVSGGFAELVLVEEQDYLPLGRTTFRTNSDELLPYLNGVEINVPTHPPGSQNLIFVVRLYPGLFGLPYLETPRFTLKRPLGGLTSGGGTIPPPRLDGFRQVGCAEQVTILPERALSVAGERVEIKLIPPIPMSWRKWSPPFPDLLGAASLTFTNVQEADGGVYAAERYCPGILTLAPYQHLFSTLIVIPRIEVLSRMANGVCTFTFTTRPGVIYSLERSTSLGPGAWAEISSVSETTGIAELSDTNRIDPAAFYRVAARLPPISP